MSSDDTSSSDGAATNSESNAPPAPTTETLLEDTNRLLAAIGVPSPLESLFDLRSSASSMFVAIFESVFAVYLAEVRRQPRNDEDYVFNAQLVLTGLRRMLPDSVQFPTTITGEVICSGDIPAIRFMVSMFTELHRIIAKATSEQLAAAGGGDGAGAGAAAGAAAAGGSVETFADGGSSTVASVGTASNTAPGQPPVPTATPAAVATASGGARVTAGATGCRRRPGAAGGAGHRRPRTSPAARKRAPARSTGRRPATAAPSRRKAAPPRAATRAPASRRRPTSAGRLRRPGAARATTTGRRAVSRPRSRGAAATSAGTRRGGAGAGTSFGTSAPFSMIAEGWTRPATAPARRTAGLGASPATRLEHSGGSGGGARPASGLDGTTTTTAAAAAATDAGYRSDLWLSTTPDLDDVSAGASSAPGSADDAKLPLPDPVGPSAPTTAVEAATTVPPSGARAQQQAAAGAAVATAPATSASSPKRWADRSTRFVRERKRVEPVVTFGGPVADADVLLAQQKASKAHTMLRKLQLQQRREEMDMKAAQERVRIAERAALKDRAATLRKEYRCMVTNAIARSKAAKHDRRVKLIRTKCLLDTMQRRTMSLRLKRASLQSTLQAKLLKEAADQERLNFIDERRAAMFTMESQQRLAAMEMDAARHTSKVRLDLVKERAEAARQEREVALRAQQLALKRMARELLGEEQENMEELQTRLMQMEQRFLAEFVEPLDTAQSRGGAPDPVELLQALGDSGGPDPSITSTIPWHTASAPVVGAPYGSPPRVSKSASAGGRRRRTRRTPRGPHTNAATGRVTYAGVRRDTRRVYGV